MYIGALGETGEEMHVRAKRYVAEYESLYKTAERIKNDEAVKEIMTKIGKGVKDDTPRYFYNEVKQYIANAESAVPTNYLVWQVGTRPIHRLDGLKKALSDIGPLITDYAKRFGLMPEGQKSQVVEKEKIVERLVEGEFMGLPTKTWLYISGGVAVTGIMAAIIVAATKPKPRHAMAGMSGKRRRARAGMGH